MTAVSRPGYRFATEAQWSTCLFVRADSDSLSAGIGLRPFAPYASRATRYGSAATHAPAGTRFHEIVWRDGAGHLHRMAREDDEPEAFAAPHAIARARRIVVDAHGLWAAGDSPSSLHRYELDTLTRLASIDIPDARVVDLASDLQDRVFVLVQRGPAWQVLRIDCGVQLGDPVTLDGIADATDLVYLKRFDRFVVLAGNPAVEAQGDEPRPCPRLYWFAAAGGKPVFSVAVAATRPCFRASALGGDARGRVLLAGIDHEELGGRPYAVLFDGDGNRLGEMPLDTPATGITATRDSAWVTTLAGVRRFPVTGTVPLEGGEVRSTLITPVLQSPDREDRRRWLRVEASASLPPGTTIEISHASTDDRVVRDRMVATAADHALPAAVRAQRLAEEPDLWSAPIVFFGGDVQADESRAPFAAPLFDVREQYLWVSVSLVAPPGSTLPTVTKLAVLYPGRTLMEHLPAIYQRAESEPGNVLRGLVGVLESTTQDLDERIGAMGSHVHPITASPVWLDAMARWLGLPWDDALRVDQKQRILERAADLAQSRGTRAGLETLLDSVMPGRPRRFRVMDPTADVGFAMVGGGRCEGSALPAMLGGLTRWSPTLDASAVLGIVRLPCDGQVDDGAWQIAGRIRVDVAASAAERRAWEPWLSALIDEMLPLTTRVELQWVHPGALRRNVLDDTVTLAAAPLPHLGTDAVTGSAKLPERGTRLSPTGPDAGIRLH